MYLAVAGLVPSIVFAKAVDLTPRAIVCDFSTEPVSGDTCESFASSWGLSVDDLKKLNPGVQCPGLDGSRSYCVIGTVNSDPEPTTTTRPPITTSKPSTTTPPTTSTTSPAAPSNSPTMPGVAANCDKFYKVSSGDQCDIISSKFGISTAQLKNWNSEINTGS